MMYEVLCTHTGLSAWLLRVWMWCRWSHSAVYDYERGVITQSTFLSGGVHEIEAKEFFAQYTRYEMRRIPIAADRVTAAQLWLAAQIGKRYDWTALFGIAFHRNWAEDDAWFCSELTETLWTEFAKRRFRASMSRVTPAHQDMLA